MIDVSDEVNQALQKIARGTGIVFAGTVISMLFGFLSRAIIARYFETSHYGVYSLALTIISIGLILATLGFQNSLPREISVYREKYPSKVKTLISTAFLIVLFNSILILILLNFIAPFTVKLFHEENLPFVLKIMSLSLPFSALTGTIVAISRGFSRVRERVYFQNILYPLVFLVLVGVGILLDADFRFIFFAYVIAQALTFMALFLDATRMGFFKFQLSLDLTLGKKLIVFSLPLLLTGILSYVMNWTDTLMLGYYKSSEVVGIYNAASPLARLLPIFLNSAGFIYMPIASQLYAQGKLGEMGRVYQILTKWVFLLTLPIFSIMFLFPEVTISFFFGTKYLEAAEALRILALGFMFHTFLGLNGLSLVVIGDTNFNFIANLFAAISNVILNILLIPEYGIVGAAVATAASYFVANVVRSLKLYQRTKIHPFSWNYVKPLVISFLLLGIIQLMNLKVSNIWEAGIILVAFLVLYFGLVLLSKSIDIEDIDLLVAIEKKLGIDLRLIKRILRRFV